MKSAVMTFAVCALAVTMVLPAPVVAQGPGRHFSHASTTLPVSAVALATVVAQKSAGLLEVDLLIIWRGSPGWFLKGSGSRESGGGSAAGFSGSMSRGGVDLDFQLITQPRSLKIQGASVDLGVNNVVLVDEVDGSQGPRVVSVASVGREGIEDWSQIAGVLARSPEVIAFLQCDIALDSPGARAATERVCREIGRQ